MAVTASGPLQLVWFKRDLRIHDHRPLLLASQQGPVLPLWVVEPELWQQPDASERQWAFAAECAAELRVELAALGQPLIVRVGDAVDVFERARRLFGVQTLWSHEETGNGWTYARDRRIAAWARHHGIRWRECAQFGVVRKLAHRDGWARRWDEQMKEPLTPPPTALPRLPDVAAGPIPSAASLGLAKDPCPDRQRGGRRIGLQLLDSFIRERGTAYPRELSSPLTAFHSCSRLSPHLAWGTLSMREVVQRSLLRPRSHAAKAFEQRLHWHCHFIQKLEDQPDLETTELHPLAANLRSGAEDWFRVPQDERLQAWAQGCTGLPFVDACMRALHATGWLNFRMRAMLISVASYHLWLPWQQTGLVLARLFVDYEPGIHWCQCQMQSGTTGINAVRMYNPIKQGIDHDPDGIFIRSWLPELTPVPVAVLHEPWTLSPQQQDQLQWHLGIDYPAPIVDVAAAARQARERLRAYRRQQGFQSLADAIQVRHGSRRAGLVGSSDDRSRSGRTRRAKPQSGVDQLVLDLE